MSFSRTQKFCATGALVLAVVSLTLAGWHAAGSSRSNLADMRNANEMEVASLAVKSRKGVSLPEQKEEFRRALRADNFQAADKIASTVATKVQGGLWSQSAFAEFMTGLIDPDTPGMDQRLDAWVISDRKNPLHLVIRAQHEYEVGWRLRGHGFSADVEPANQVAFQEHLKKSLLDIQAAFKIKIKAPPYIYVMKLQVLQSVGSPQDRQATFQLAVDAFPDYYPLYQVMLASLQPKWGGSIDAMYRFVEERTMVADRYPPLHLLYIELYEHLVDAALISCESASVSDRADCMSGFVSDDLKTNVHRALFLCGHLDKYQFGEAIRQPVEQVVRMQNAGVLQSFLLLAAADALHSDTRLVEAHTDQNNYIIDELVAESWYRAGHYDNALKKSQEALTAMKRTYFPDGEAQDRTRARIDLQMSVIAGKLHEYVAQASYEKASSILGGRNYNEHAICFAFFKAASRDQVLSACDEAVALNEADMETYYWRAQYRIDRQEGREAVADLQRVAASSSYLRTLSAINLSMIWFGRNNNAAALNVLNKYTYLYDEKASSRSDIAIAYNNRCYAYMQLGDNRKALSDCNSSLRYENIPDAYAKKSELEKRLTNLPI